jgi:hypothetical protein
MRDVVYQMTEPIERRTEPIERRKVERVRLGKALPAKVNGARGYVIEASIEGLLVAHQSALLSPGNTCEIAAEWDGQPMNFTCEVEWTEQRGIGDRGAVFHSGMLLTHADPPSCNALRECVEWHVMRALEEQKANARGVPVAGAAWSSQTGGGTEYVRHDFFSDRWTTVRTTQPTQPRSGFTVSVQCTVGECMMLREAYERADDGLRKVIRELALASIEQVNGIPTRRFVP